MQNFGTNSSMQVPGAYLCSVMRSLFLSALSQVTATGCAQTMEPLINALTDSDVEKPKKKKESKERQNSHQLTTLSPGISFLLGSYH